MPLVFKTHESSAEAVEIVGAGMLFPHGKGGIPVAEAAEVLSELQEKNDDGTVKLDRETGEPIPLTGAKLTAAAREFADSRDITTVNVPEGDIASLPQEAGVPADRPPLAEVGRAEGEAAYGHLSVVNDDPEELVDPTGSGVPVISGETSDAKTKTTEA